MATVNCNVKPKLFLLRAFNSGNEKFTVFLAPKLKCSHGKIKPHAYRQSPPTCSNFGKSFVKWIRTKDFVSAAPVFHKTGSYLSFFFFFARH